MDKKSKERMNMKLAEKIFNERKRLGLSQEQFAEKMEVSRQAVSKWESGQSMPDLDKLVWMSQIFGVSTDYLLKDEGIDVSMETETGFMETDVKLAEMDSLEKTARFEQDSPTPQSGKTARVLNKEELENYRAISFKASSRIALGVFLCIFGLVLCVGVNMYFEPKGIDTDLPVALLLLCVAIAVGLFVSSGLQMEKYTFLKTIPFDLPETEEKQLAAEYEEYHKKFSKNITIGVVLCIFSVIVNLLCSSVGQIYDNVIWDEYIAPMVLFTVIAIAVYIFVASGVKKEYYDILLQQNAYAGHLKKERSEKNDIMGVVAGAYWCIVTAGFLAYSLITMDWGRSWIVWPVAGCLFGAISVLLTLCKQGSKSELK